MSLKLISLFIILVPDSNLVMSTCKVQNIHPTATATKSNSSKCGFILSTYFIPSFQSQSCRSTEDFSLLQISDKYESLDWLVHDLILDEKHQRMKIYLQLCDNGQFIEILRAFLAFLNSDDITKGSSYWKPQVFIDILKPPSLALVQSELDSHNLKVPTNVEVFVFLNDDKTVKGDYLMEMFDYKNNTQYQAVTENFTFGTGETGDEDFNQFLLSNMLYIKPISVRRKNMSGINLQAVAQNDPDYQPRIQIKIDANGTAEFSGGQCLSIFLDLQTILGFSYKAVNGEGWMGIFPNGTWTGMSGQVINQGVDIAIVQGSTIMMADQLHGISFLHPTSTGKLVAIFRQPQANSIRDIVTSAFHPTLWASCLLLWLILLLVLRLLFKIIRVKGVPYDEEDEEFVGESFWWAISATSYMGWHSSPNSYTLRLAFTMGLFFTSIIFVAYAAALIAILFTETVPIKSFKDLSKSPIRIYSDLWLPMAHHVMEEAYSIRKDHIKNMDAYKIQLESAISQIIKKSSAFITFLDGINVVFHRLNYTDQFFCDNVYRLLVSKIAFPNAMFVKRGSPLREIINPKILMMIERGFINRLNRIYDLQTQVICPSLGQQYRGGLGFRDVLTPFFILVFGSCLSFIQFCIEKNIGKLWNCICGISNSVQLYQEEADPMSTHIR